MPEFVFHSNPTFTRAIDITLPDNQVQTLTLHFKAISVKQRQNLFNGKADLKDSLAEIITGWDDVVDTAGNSVPFSPENLAEIMDCEWVFQPVIDAYSSALKGESTDRLKK